MKTFTVLQRTFLIALALLLANFSVSGQDAPKAAEPTIKWSGYVGAYYAWDNDKGANPRQFSFIAPNREEFGLDIAMLSFEYAADKVRAKATIQYGDVVRGWSGISTDALLNRGNIQEAYAGFRLGQGFWVDAGFFLTHVGTEGFFPKDNFLSTLATTTLYEPFGQAGVRFTYEFSNKLTGQLNLLNGFSTFASDQPSNESPRAQAFGIQLTYKLSDNAKVVYDNVIGEVNAGANFRTYHNLYFSVTSGNLEFNVGGDFATQNKTPTAGESATYLSGLAEARYGLSDLVRVMGRVEYFNDEKNVLGSGNLQLAGFTGGFDLRPAENGFIRLEGRYLQGLDDAKRFNGASSKSRLEVVVTTGVSF
ncbi:MAG: outer membrane beta-barrel protein [Chloroherpetonaceae bacterium]|nr:outer membrane beta-barrel protein [Chloroherpetonaceae bacterium]